MWGGDGGGRSKVREGGEGFQVRRAWLHVCLNRVCGFKPRLARIDMKATFEMHPLIELNVRAEPASRPGWARLWARSPVEFRPQALTAESTAFRPEWPRVCTRLANAEGIRNDEGD